MNEHLQNGWRMLQPCDAGVLGAAGLATAPETNFLRLVRVLRQRESFRPLLADERALAADPGGSTVDDLRRHIVPWSIGQPEIPALKLLEVASSPPIRTLQLNDGSAGQRLATIADLLVRFHQHGISMNLLSPRSIVYWSDAADAPPTFFDAGIECRADLTELEDPALVGRPYTAAEVGFWAPEQIQRLRERRPATFAPASDVYFLAAAWTAAACAEDFFATTTIQAALREGSLAFLVASRSLRVPAEITHLLDRALQDDPATRPAVSELAPLWQFDLPLKNGTHTWSLPDPRPWIRGTGRALSDARETAWRGVAAARRRVAGTFTSGKSIHARAADPAAVEPPPQPDATAPRPEVAPEADATRRWQRTAAALSAVLGLGVGLAASAEARPMTSDVPAAESATTAACLRRYAVAWRLATDLAPAARGNAEARAELEQHIEAVAASDCGAAPKETEEATQLPRAWREASDVEARTRALLRLARARAASGEDAAGIELALATSPAVAALLTPTERALVGTRLPVEAPPPVGPYAVPANQEIR